MDVGKSRMPDATKIMKFRHLPEAHRLAQGLFPGGGLAAEAVWPEARQVLLRQSFNHRWRHQETGVAEDQAEVAHAGPGVDAQKSWTSADGSVLRRSTIASGGWGHWPQTPCFLEILCNGIQRDS